jgi:hypothetical protein
VIAPIVPTIRLLPVHGVVLPLDDGRYSIDVFVSRSTLEDLKLAAMDEDGEQLELDRQDAKALGQAGWAEATRYGWMPTREFLRNVWPEVLGLPYT